jgi:hypothetical protein
MKYLRILGFTAIAALALAAGSASATVLCSTATSPCTGTKYGSGTTIQEAIRKGTKTTIVTNIATISCGQVMRHGKVTSSGEVGSTATGETTSVTTSDCSTPSGTGCTVTSTKGPWPWEIHYNGLTPNGTQTVKKGSGEAYGFMMMCGALINCKFTSTQVSSGVTGGAPGIVVIKNLALEREGGFCPASATLNAEFEVAAPNPLYVAAS